MQSTTIVYLITDMSKKHGEVLHVTVDPIKAANWKELLDEQGNDAQIITIDGECIEKINSLVSL